MIRASKICVIILALLVMQEFGFCGKMREPWQSAKMSTDGKSSALEKKPGSGSYASQISFGWLHVYRHYLGVVMRSKCPMEPSCSTYSMMAIDKHGAVIGCVMTADRLFRESDDMRKGRKAYVNGRLKVLDNVSDNDFWWRAAVYEQM